MESRSAGPTAPVKPAGRIVDIDIIRGFALFGILLVNMGFFKSPLFYLVPSPSVYAPGADRLGAWIIQLLATGKFYAIFSFLFGLGFYIFMNRLSARGLDPQAVFSRRLLGLLLMGLLHLGLIWTGDILVAYSIVGFILLAFRNTPPRALLRWIAALFFLSLLVEGGFFLIYGASQVYLGEEFIAQQAAFKEAASAVLQRGSAREILIHRLTAEVPGALFTGIVYYPSILMYFLSGLYAGRIGLFSHPDRNLPMVRRLWRWGIVAGPALSVLYVLAETGALPVPDFFRFSVLRMVNQAGAIFLSGFYVSSLILLLRRPLWRRLLSPLAGVGRMALTNYLTQSLVCVFIFYGYGLGQFGRVSVWGGMALTLALLSVQTLWSGLWLSRFQYGPLEWLWRGFTYGRRPPLRKGAARAP